MGDDYDDSKHVNATEGLITSASRQEIVNMGQDRGPER